MADVISFYCVGRPSLRSGRVRRVQSDIREKRLNFVDKKRKKRKAHARFINASILDRSVHTRLLA